MFVKVMAVVGIDGSGKSTVVEHVIRALSPRARVVAMRFPALHETRDLPYSDLSRDLRELSRIGDELGCGGLKATALYLAATLVGPVERFAVQSFRPALLVAERHPVVDVLTYTPVYKTLIHKTRPLLDVAGEVRRTMAVRRPAGMEAIERWVAAEAERLGVARTLWSYPEHIASLPDLPPDARLAVVERECQVTAPDAVAWLDVDPAIAAERTAGRERAELHESRDALARLRARYEATFGELRVLRPSMAFHTIAPPPGASVERVAESLGEIVQRHLTGAGPGPS